MNRGRIGRAMDILMVENSPADVRLVQEILRLSNRDLQLHTVMDGVAAMSFLRREGDYADVPRPYLILLDLNLPKKDGFQVLSEIKEDLDLRSIPVIVLTTSVAQEDIQKAYKLLANCYIIKPIDLDDFVRVVRIIEDFWLATVRLPVR